MKHRLELLELLRFLLALNIVFYHYFYIGPLGNWIDGPSIALPYLLFSVHAFFAVSGFVIMRSASGRTWDEFVVARVARLGPALLVCGTATFVVLWAWPLDLINVRLIQWIRSILVIPLAAGSGVDLSYWSLKYEVIFYALVAILIWRGITPARLLLLMGLMLASDCVSLLMSATGVNLKWSPTSVYGAFFCIGILFHLHRTSAAPRKALRDLWPFWIATIVIASIDAVVDFRWTEVGMLAQSPPAWWSGPLIAMVIVSIFGLFIGGTSVAPLSRLFRILGMASYPLYLLHQQFGYWSIRLQEKTLGIGVQAARLVTILAMVGLATAFSMFVEPVLMRAYARTGTQLMNRFKLRTSGQTAGI